MFYLLLLLFLQLGCRSREFKVFLHHETESSVKVRMMSALFVVIDEAPEPRAMPGIQSALNTCLINFE